MEDTNLLEEQLTSENTEKEEEKSSGLRSAQTESPLDTYQPSDDWMTDSKSKQPRSVRSATVSYPKKSILKNGGSKRTSRGTVGGEGKKISFNQRVTIHDVENWKKYHQHNKTCCERFCTEVCSLI